MSREPRQFSFALTEAEFVRASWIANLKQLRGIIIFYAVLAVVFLVGDPIKGGLTFLALSVAATGWMYFRGDRSAKGMYRDQRSLREPQQVELTESEILYGSESGTTRISWTDIFMWSISKEFFIIYLNRLHMTPIPLSAMGANNVDFMRERLVDSGLTQPLKKRK